MEPSIKSLAERGGHCPTCGQRVQLYQRKLNSTMAHGLVWFVAEWYKRGGYDHPEALLHVNSMAPRWLVKAGGTFATLEHWGLIEQGINTNSDKRNSGCWRPTKLGLAFVGGAARVPRRVYLYNGEKHGESPMLISIEEAMAEKFSFQELMGSPASFDRLKAHGRVAE